METWPAQVTLVSVTAVTLGALLVSVRSFPGLPLHTGWVLPVHRPRPLPVAVLMLYHKVCVTASIFLPWFMPGFSPSAKLLLFAIGAACLLDSIVGFSFLIFCFIGFFTFAAWLTFVLLLVCVASVLPGGGTRLVTLGTFGTFGYIWLLLMCVAAVRGIWAVYF